jgi:hypothetical protein
MTAVAGCVICGAAWGQEDGVDKAKLAAEKLATVRLDSVGVVRFGMMGPTVKGAPYAADGVTETTQTLGDGTHINRQETYTIYRDAEGRVRRESGDDVWISDPVAGVSYVLDMQRQTVRKMSLSRGLATTKMMADAQQVKVRAEMAADQRALRNTAVVVRDDGPVFFAGGTMNAGGEGKPEALGKQFMEGVEVEGTRTTIAIPQGQIGNDRALQIVSERWESPELHVTVMSKHTDPMMGDSTERLTNIRRGEPDAALFQAPAGWAVEAEK